jgi:hypothetical protein
MSKIHRPNIKMNISKWEILLIGIHVLVVFLLYTYYALRWDSIPDIITSNSIRGKDMNKYNYAYGGAWNYILILASFILSCFILPKYPGNLKVKSLSNDLSKAEQQYRVERSNLLSISIIVHSLVILGTIIEIEGRIKNIDTTAFIAIMFPCSTIILVIISRCIHRVLWWKLSD